MSVAEWRATDRRTSGQSDLCLSAYWPSSGGCTALHSSLGHRWPSIAPRTASQLHAHPTRCTTPGATLAAATATRPPPRSSSERDPRRPDPLPLILHPPASLPSSASYAHAHGRGDKFKRCGGDGEREKKRKEAASQPPRGELNVCRAPRLEEWGQWKGDARRLASLSWKEGERGTGKGAAIGVGTGERRTTTSRPIPISQPSSWPAPAAALRCATRRHSLIIRTH